jgi:hydrogenase maturation protease
LFPDLITERRNPSSILVLGLGNILLSDEGVGIRALEALQQDYIWPDTVTLMDGGVMGLEIMPYLESASKVLVLDAVVTQAPPATLVRLADDEIPAVVAMKMSVHQVGFQEALAMCTVRDTLPEAMVLLGVTPQTLEPGVGLSSGVEAQIPSLVREAVAVLRAWEVEPALDPL